MRSVVLRERSVPVTAELAGPTDVLSGKARVWFGLSLALVAGNLRPAITSLPPLLPEISHAYRLGPLTSSLLVAIPVLLLGVGSPLASLLARRFGLTRAMDAGLLLISGGVAARSISVSAMFPGTAVAALGIAVVAVLLPAWIAWRDARSVGIWTSVYALAMALGASIAPAMTGLLATRGVPLRLSLILWALLPMAAIAVRVAVRGGSSPGDSHPAIHVPRLWLVLRGPVIPLTGFFLLQALLFFSIVTWLPVYARAGGGSAAGAGATLAIFSGVGMVGAWCVPLLARHVSARVPLALGLCACGTTGFALLGLGAPLLAAVACLALGQGGAFPLALALIGFKAEDSKSAAALSTAVQGVGFGFASIGLAMVAVLHTELRTWSALWWLLAAVALAQTTLAWAAARPGAVALDRGGSPPVQLDSQDMK